MRMTSSGRFLLRVSERVSSFYALESGRSPDVIFNTLKDRFRP